MALLLATALICMTVSIYLVLTHWLSVLERRQRAHRTTERLAHISGEEAPKTRNPDEDAGAKHTASVRLIMWASGRGQKLVDILPTKLKRLLSVSPALIVSAGLERDIDARGFVRARIVLAACGGSLGILAYFVGFPLLATGVMVLCAAFLGAYLPLRTLRIAQLVRIARVTADLPEMIEMVALGFMAGASFDNSVSLYCEKFRGPLADEMYRAYSSWFAGGVSRKAALLLCADRVQAASLTRFVHTVIQAMEMGTPLADILFDQIEEARRIHRAQIEESISKAPVKMLIPMGTLILPAMLLFVLGPVVLGMASGF